MQKRALGFSIFFTALMILMTGCASHNTTLTLQNSISLPPSVKVDNQALSVNKVIFYVKEAEFNPHAFITDVSLPESSEYQIKLINDHQQGACWNSDTSEGAKLTPDVPQCALTFGIIGHKPQKISDHIIVKVKKGDWGIWDNKQQITVPVNIEVVSPDSNQLAEIKVDKIHLGVDKITVIKLRNPDSNTVPVNNVQIHIADWLKSLIDNDQQTGILSLEPGGVYHFDFQLTDSKQTVASLHKHKKQLENNEKTGVIAISAANIPDTIEPPIQLNHQPADLSDVAFINPKNRQTRNIVFSNQADSVLTVQKIDASSLPKGIRLDKHNCLNQMIASDEACEIPVTLLNRLPAFSSKVWIYYKDSQDYEFKQAAIVKLEQTN